MLGLPHMMFHLLWQYRSRQSFALTPSSKDMWINHRQCRLLQWPPDLTCIFSVYHCRESWKGLNRVSVLSLNSLPLYNATLKKKKIIVQPDCDHLPFTGKLARNAPVHPINPSRKKALGTRWTKDEDYHLVLLTFSHSSYTLILYPCWSILGVLCHFQMLITSGRPCKLKPTWDISISQSLGVIKNTLQIGLDQSKILEYTKTADYNICKNLSSKWKKKSLQNSIENKKISDSEVIGKIVQFTKQNNSTFFGTSLLPDFQKVSVKHHAWLLLRCWIKYFYIVYPCVQMQ